MFKTKHNNGVNQHCMVHKIPQRGSFSALNHQICETWQWSRYAHPLHKLTSFSSSLLGFWYQLGQRNQSNYLHVNTSEILSRINELWGLLASTLSLPLILKLINLPPHFFSRVVAAIEGHHHSEKPMLSVSGLAPCQPNSSSQVVISVNNPLPVIFWVVMDDTTLRVEPVTLL